MMQNKVVITRPPEDSVEIAQEITTRNLVPLIEPVLSIVYKDDPLPAIPNDMPLVFTSANGVRAFARKSAGRGHPVYTVGRNTADEARQAGFEKVESASGNAYDLVNFLKNGVKTGLTDLFYVRGEEISVDLGEILAKNDLKLTEFIGYKANLAQNLSVNLLKSLDNREIKAVLLYSARGARHFSDLVEQYDRTFRMKTIRALCISNEVLQSCSALPFGDALVADKPDRYGMIRLLEKLATAE